VSAGQFSVQIVQSRSDRGVNDFVTNLDPDSADQLRVSVNVQLQLATKSGRQRASQAIKLSLLEWTGHRHIGDQLTWLLCAQISETTNKINRFDSARIFNVLTYQQLR